MSDVPKYVTVKKCAELLGLTPNAVDQYRKKGQWRQFFEWEKAPNGRIYINMPAVYTWIENRQA